MALATIRRLLSSYSVLYSKLLNTGRDLVPIWFGTISSHALLASLKQPVVTHQWGVSNCTLSGIVGAWSLLDSQKPRHRTARLPYESAVMGVRVPDPGFCQNRPASQSPWALRVDIGIRPPGLGVLPKLLKLNSRVQGAVYSVEHGLI